MFEGCLEFSGFCCFSAVVQPGADAKPLIRNPNKAVRGSSFLTSHQTGKDFFLMISPFVLDFVAGVPESFLDLPTVGLMELWSTGCIPLQTPPTPSSAERSELLQTASSAPPPRLLCASSAPPPSSCSLHGDSSSGRSASEMLSGPLAPTLFGKGSH